MAEARSLAVRSSSTERNALPGMKNWRMQASSLGRKAERTREVLEARGLPMPPRFRVSVPTVVLRWKVYVMSYGYPEGENVPMLCSSITCTTRCTAETQSGVMKEASEVEA